MNGRIRKVEVSSSLTFPGSIHVRSYLREDLLFGKSFSRCQPAAGRTKLTARTPQFLFPLPLPSSFFHLRPPFAPPFICRLLSFHSQRLFIRVWFGGPVFYSPQLKVKISRKVATTTSIPLACYCDSSVRQCKFNDGIRYYDYLRRNYSSSYRCTNSRLSVKRSQQWAWFIVEFTTNNISSSTE